MGQQAIFVDIALFFPSLLLGVGGLIAKQAGAVVPPAAGELFNDGLFGALLLTLLYCSVSSLFGQEPDKIPLISNAVKDRMPTMEMFDNDGKFVPREERKEKDDKSDKDQEK